MLYIRVGMTDHLRKKICGGLCFLFIMMLLHIHFQGDSCMIHCEHTAHPLGATLSVRAATCLCFFHAVYAPVEVLFFVFPLEIPLAENVIPDRYMPLVSFDIFHPPRP